MKFAVRPLALGLLLLVFGAGPAAAQYMKITTDNPTNNTQMNAGTTLLTITLDSNHDKNASLQTCGSHQAALCGGATTTDNLDVFAYTIILTAVGGTVSWGTFTPSDAAYGNGGAPVPTTTQVEINYSRASGVTPQGLFTIGTIPVTPTSGNPSIVIARGQQPIDPSAFGTLFGTSCTAGILTGSYLLGDPADPCGAGIGDWFDADGVAAAAGGNALPQVTAPPTATGTEGVAIATITATATDPDAGQTLTITQSGKPADLTFTSVPSVSPATATITGTPGFSDAGTYNIQWSVSDGNGGTGTATTVLTIENGNQAPVLAQPANMTVNEGATADQTLNATDADGQPLAFSLTIGPSFAAVTTTSAGTGTATGNLHLAPGFSDAGTYSATVGVTDGTAANSKSLTITVVGVNRAPILSAVTDMTVQEGTTGDQALTGSDPDGDPLTFAKASGPSFMTVTTTTATTGNIHLAPQVGDAGTYSASVTASDGTATSTPQSFAITVTPAAQQNQAPVLGAVNDMTVDEGATADQVISATDADGDPLTFSGSGAAFMTVTTTSPGTGTASGNIHLAPGFGDAGTYTATASVSDGKGGNDSQSFTITVNNVNRAPTLNAITDMTVQEGTTGDQAVTGSDPDGDPLTFAKASGPSFMTVTTTTATTGNVHLAPQVGDAGTYSASVTASDGTATSAPQSFTITVTPAGQQNNAPVLGAVNDMTVDEGATADQAISATDADGDPLTFSGSGAAFMTVTTTSPGTGTASGNIHLAPGFGDAGTYTATASVSDGKGGNDSQPFTITVNNVNRAPTLNAITDMTVQEGTTGDQAVTGSDPDGDPLTFAKASGPSFMTVTTTTATTGNVHLAPQVGDAGTYSASVTASDGTATSAPQSFTITVTPAGQQNNAPVLGAVNDMTVDEGATADQAISATDADGDPLTFSGSGAAFMTVTTTSPGTGTASGNIHLAPGFGDAGTYTATASVSDGKGGNDSQPFTITVNNVNRAPIADAGGPYGGVINVPITFNGTGSSDPDGDVLTYSWDFDFTDGITVDATGPSPVHTYTSAGIYTVTLTVSDGSLQGTDTAVATVSNEILADAFNVGGDKTIRLASGKPLWCVQIQPISGSFNVTDVNLSTIQATYAGVTINAISGKTTLDGDRNGDGISELKACFSKDDLRTLFASLPNGRTRVDVLITGQLNSGAPFSAHDSVDVVKAGGGALARLNASASPNPFNPATTISFQTTRPGNVTLQVFDVSGRLVNTLANQYMGSGYHEVRWGGTNVSGSKISSGVYFYVLKTGEGTVKNQLVIAK